MAIEASNFHIKLLPSDKKKKEKKQHNKDDNESKGKYKRKEDKGSRERKEHSSNEKYGEKHSYDKSIEVYNHFFCKKTLFIFILIFIFLAESTFFKTRLDLRENCENRLFAILQFPQLVESFL